MQFRTRFSTSFSTTAELYNAVKNVSHELKISASDLICRAIEEYLQKKSLNPTPAIEEKECFQKDKENTEGSHGLL